MLFSLLALGTTATPAAGSTPVIAAHRAITGPGQIENSLDAIAGAMRSGVDVAEVDLRRSADDRILLWHDPRVRLPGGGSGPIERLTVPQLSDRGKPIVATLESALDASKGSTLTLLLDLKRPASIAPARLLGLAEDHGALDRIIIGARKPEVVRSFRALSASLPILAFAEAQSDIEPAIAAGATIVRVWPRWLFTSSSGCLQGRGTDCLVQRLQKRGVKVWVLTDGSGRPDVDRRCFAAIKQLNVDGILSNRPLDARDSDPDALAAADFVSAGRSCTGLNS